LDSDNPKKLLGTLTLHPQEVELASMIIARMLYVANPAIDESEATDLIEEFLQETELDLGNSVELATAVVRMTTFDPKWDVWN
jgi:hypothetical protein